MEKKVVTRFAPSPTGYLHAGNYRTALFAYLFARQNDGKFILRIEDTDKARSKKEYEDNIIDSLKWLGLEYDDFYRQSDRTDVYKKYIEKLIADGKAYISKETPKNEGDRSEVIRFKNPNKKVSWVDMVRGEITFDTTDLGDFVIARSIDEPVFHLVVVVDDHESGVTHILRGEDHISNTPRHILIHEALGFDLPIYAHIPLLLASDRSKMSKRKGALPITEYRNRGYMSEAIFNYMALLGWNPGDDREILSKEDLIRDFNLSKVQKSGAIFDEEKLSWVNKEYMDKLSSGDYKKRLVGFLPENFLALPNSDVILGRALGVIREKIRSFGEVRAIVGDKHGAGELSFIYKVESIDSTKINWKGESDSSRTIAHIKEVIKNLESIPESDWDKDRVKSSIWEYAEKEGRGNVLWPFRYSITGLDKSPDPFVSAYILGKTETLTRLTNAVSAISK